MGHFKPIIAFLVFVFMVGISADAWADLTGSGSITYDSGFYARGDNWAGPGTFLAWTVFQRTDGNFEYDYTFALPSDAKNISHIIVQVSNNFSNADMLPGTTSGGIINTYGGQGSSNLGMPAALYGIKWDVSATPSTSFAWTIVTDRTPMMGNFYARDGAAGGGVYAYSGTKDLFGNDVVVPGSVIPAPVPASVWLLGSVLIGLAGIRTRKKLTEL